MCRLTRKPRLFGTNAHRFAGTSAMLLALASPLASAQDVSADASLAVREAHEDDAPFVRAGATTSPTPWHKVTGPLGWTAAGALLALALWPPGAARSTEGA